MSASEPLAQLQWRKSSFSGDGFGNGGTCVEAAALSDGRVAVRNSNHPEAGVVFFARPEMNAWLESIKAGEFDNLT